MPDFKTITLDSLLSGKDNEGKRYLELFLAEYSQMFSTKVNPGCIKCLTDYLNKYQNKFKAMSNTCKFRLQAKYENIPLEFGSPVLVNNGNITDEYAAKLLKHNNGQRYFAEMPENWEQIAEQEAQLVDSTGPDNGPSEVDGHKETIVPKEEAPKGGDDSQQIAEQEAQLVDAYIKADNAVNDLPEGTHHMTVKAAKAKAEEAQNALADFRQANGLIQE